MGSHPPSPRTVSVTTLADVTFVLTTWKLSTTPAPKSGIPKKRTQEKEVVTFETSFGVRFGLFICKDLCHSEPQRSLLDGSRAHGGATQIPFSVAAPHTFLVRWFYRRWSEKRGATLLASNRGGGGGIFAGGKGGKSHVVKRHGCTVATIHL